MGSLRSRRYDNLRRIERLDPVADFEEIFWLTAYHELPWEYVQGTSIAFLRDYGVPSISDLLDRTAQFEHHGQKRYDDTVLIGHEAVRNGVDHRRTYPFGYSLADLGPRTFGPPPATDPHRSSEQTRSAT